MRLIITEKPKSAKAIAAVLGNVRQGDGHYVCGDTVVTFCVGHLFELVNADHYLSDDIPKTSSGNKVWRLDDLPIIPEIWKFKPTTKTKGELATIGKLIKGADEVIQAGDNDREGQAIVDHVLDHFKCSVPVKRMIYSALDEIPVKRALSDLKDNRDYAGWRHAAIARQRADWLVGINLSRSFTLEAQAKGDRSLLVVGRVQTPTLALVVARDRLIENFNPTNYYLVEADVSVDDHSFRAKWIPSKGSACLDEQNRLVDKKAAEQAAIDLQEVSGTITKSLKEPKSTPQPLGLSLADLTLIASNKYGYTAEQTLTITQALYETHTLCSYPRTDCSYLPETQFEDAHATLIAIRATHPTLSALSGKADLSIKSRVWDTSKITAHHCIVPTMHKGNINSLSKAESQLYEIIALRYIAQFYPKHEYDQTTIEVETIKQQSEHSPYTLVASGKTITLNGWKDVYKNASNNEDGDSVSMQTLPSDIEHKQATITGGECDAKKTNPPRHFTDGTLNEALKNIHKYVDNEEYRKLLKMDDGIGTSATRAKIVSDLKRREFLTPKGKYLVSTDLGRRLVDTLPESITSPVLTAQYERELHLIQDNKGSLNDFVAEQVKYVKEQIANASQLIAANPAPKISAVTQEDGKPTFSCEACTNQLVRRKNTFKKTGFWWGCSNRECKRTYPDKRGKPDFKAKKPVANKTEFDCLKCNEPLLQRESAKKVIWYSCSAYPACDTRYFDKNGKPDFPK